MGQNRDQRADLLFLIRSAARLWADVYPSQVGPDSAKSDYYAAFFLPAGFSFGGAAFAFFFPDADPLLDCLKLS